MFEEEDENNEFINNEKIVIGLVAWRGRRHMTQVKNIPREFDLERICKYWRKVKMP